MDKWLEHACGVAEALSHLAVFLAGLAALIYGVPMLQAELTKAQHAETVAKAELVRREAAERKVLELRVSARPIGGTAHQRYLAVAIEIANTGNRVFEINAADLEAYVARVTGIAQSGTPVFDEKRRLEFGGDVDTHLERFTVLPGETKKYETVRDLFEKGIHLVRAKILLRNGSDEATKDWAYGASAYVDVE